MTFNDLKNKIFANYEAGAISDYELSGLVDDIVEYLNLKTTQTRRHFGENLLTG